jgi:hypothetical protein
MPAGPRRTRGPSSQCRSMRGGAGDSRSGYARSRWSCGPHGRRCAMRSRACNPSSRNGGPWRRTCGPSRPCRSTRSRARNPSGWNCGPRRRTCGPSRSRDHRASRILWRVGPRRRGRGSCRAYARSRPKASSDLGPWMTGRLRVHGALGALGWPDLRQGDSIRPSPVVGFLRHLWPRASVVVRIPGSLRIVVGAVARPSRAVFPVVDNVNGALQVGGAGGPGHGGSHKHGLRWGVDTVIVTGVRGPDVVELPTSIHPGLREPLPIAVIPVPAALDPERIRSLDGCPWGEAKLAAAGGSRVNLHVTAARDGLRLGVSVAGG